LRPSTVYSVKVTASVNGEAWERSWTFTTGGDGLPGPADTEAKVLAKVNAYRKTAGLAPVAAVDRRLSQGCQAHARYLVANTNHPSTDGLGMHEEQSDLPAYTEEGRRAGRASVIASVGSVESVDWWMATLFHRVPILNPGLRRIGVGHCQGGKYGELSVMDVGSATGSDQVVVYPGDKQKGVPLAFGGEEPTPIPESKDQRAGFPISVTFPPGVPVTNVTAALKEAGGREVNFWLATPEKPAVPDVQLHTVSLIAKAPLRPNTAYTVTVSADAGGQAWKQTRTFTTGK
jgi:uncharacterized protein YkwD